MKLRLFRLFGAVVFGVLLLALVATPAMAISNPTSIAMNNQLVFRNVLETGDWLVYCRYDVNYTTIPSEPANTTFEFVMYNTTGTVILGSRPLNYYQHNIISIYFTATQAAGLVWGDPYIVIVRGSPSVFITLIEDVNQDTRVLGASDYKEHSDLAGYMLSEAEILQTDWGITLLANGYLNATGATYFTYAIPAFGSMAPEAMYSSTYYMTVNYTYGGTYGNQTAYELSLHTQQGTKLRTAIQNLASEFKVSEDWMSIWLVAIGYLTFAGVAYSVTKDPGVSMLSGFPVIVGAAWLGVGTSWLTIVIAVTIIAAVLFAIHFILARFA